MLKMTGVKLEKILNIDMYLFIEKELRGGISYIANRYDKVNNKYMKNYNPTKPSKFIWNKSCWCKKINSKFGQQN